MKRGIMWLWRHLGASITYSTTKGYKIMTRTMTRTKMNKLPDLARYKVLRQHHDSHYVIASCTSLDKAHMVAEYDAWSFIGLVNESSPIYIQVWQLYDDGKWECVEQFTVKGASPIFEYLPD